MTTEILVEADWTPLRIGGIKLRLECSLVCLFFDHVDSLYLALLTKQRFQGHHSAREAERLRNITYGFHLLLRNQSVGIKTTIQFVEVQMDWSQNSPASKRASSSFSSIVG